MEIARDEGRDREGAGWLACMVFGTFPCNSSSCPSQPRAYTFGSLLQPHEFIIKLYEVLYDQPTGRLALVFELMDMNIYEQIRGRRHYLQENMVKGFIWQLIQAMDHMHRNGIFHRDVKPENILSKFLAFADLFAEHYPNPSHACALHTI